MLYLTAYGAVILSFVGAVHWEPPWYAQMRESERNVFMAWSVVPALAAWVALLMPASTAAVLLMPVTFVAQYAADRQFSLALSPSAVVPEAARQAHRGSCAVPRACILAPLITLKGTYASAAL
jgi:hypothetical protein